MIETHRARGYLLSATENYEEAIREYDAAIKVNPNIALLYLEQGKNYRAISAKDEAIQAFTKAITLNPSDPEPYYLISRTYATYGDYAKAMQYAESALQNNPADAGLHGNLGIMYYRNFLWPEAVEQLGLTVFGGKTKDGVDVTNIPLTNDTRVAEYYYTLGLALARTNQCGEALQLAQEIQSKVPSDENAAFGASEIIRICQEKLNNPAVDTPIPTAPVETETPSPTSTP
jgi:tetratricopeptide (TPR) repeat protein